ncbi:MAG TPA: outer membrane beta-barrel protein [Dyadobacter sp.]|nr:outer membrane beta-barrel protein [Dyadobacter sp.]
MAGFYVHDESYIKAEVDVDVASTALNDLSYNPQPKLEKAIVFLRLIVDGPKQLLQLSVKDSKNQLYISDQPGTYVLLINYKYMANNGSTQIISPNQYKDQLQNLFADCEGLLQNKASLTYSASAISRVFYKFYEKCSDRKPVLINKQESTKLEIGILAGLSGTKFNFDLNSSETNNGNFPVSNNVAGGVFLNLVFPRLNQKLSFYNELAFTTFKSQIVKQTDFSDNSYNRTTSKIGFGYIKLFNMVRFSLPVGPAKFFMGAGISNAGAIAERNERITESRFQNTEPVISSGVFVRDPRKYEFGLVANLGVSYNKIGAEFRYETANVFSPFPGLKSSVKRYYFLLSYRLK